MLCDAVHDDYAALWLQLIIVVIIIFNAVISVITVRAPCIIMLRYRVRHTELLLLLWKFPPKCHYYYYKLLLGKLRGFASLIRLDQRTRRRKLERRARIAMPINGWGFRRGGARGSS